MYLFTMESSARMQTATWVIPRCESCAGAARPYEIGLFAQKTKPGLAIGSKSQVSLSIVALGHLQLFVSNGECCFHSKGGARLGE